MRRHVIGIAALLGVATAAGVSTLLLQPEPAHAMVHPYIQQYAAAQVTRGGVGFTPGGCNPNLSCSVASLTSGGAISGTTGTFSGAVSGTTGTFSGAVAGTTGTFSSAVSGTTGTFSSAVSGTTGTFSSTVQGSALTSTASSGSAGLNLTAGAYINMGSSAGRIRSHDGALYISNTAEDKYIALNFADGNLICTSEVYATAGRLGFLALTGTAATNQMVWNTPASVTSSSVAGLTFSPANGITPDADDTLLAAAPTDGASAVWKLDKEGDSTFGGRVTAASATFDTSTLYVDSTNDRVGIGITSPVAPLDVTTADDAASHMRIASWGGAVRSIVFLDRGKSTRASPTALVGDDLIGEIVWRGNYESSSSVSTAAHMRAYADANWSGSSTPTRIGFFTNPASSLATVHERMTINADGTVQLNRGAQAKPSCSSSNRGSLFYVAGGAGVADTMEVCAKSAADAYAWRSTSVLIP